MRLAGRELRAADWVLRERPLRVDRWTPGVAPLKPAFVAIFAILLGGALTVTPRLMAQIAGARIIAADSGMTHAESLGVRAEVWVGDFDSTDAALAAHYRHVPRMVYPTEKDATDGELAVEVALARGASEFILVGGFGGQADHMLGHVGLALALAQRGLRTVLTSGAEEAHPILPGTHKLDLPAGSRLSIIPLNEIVGLDLEGVRWPLAKRSLALGSSLTLSNIALGPVTIRIDSGYGLAIAYPQTS